VHKEYGKYNHVLVTFGFLQTHLCHVCGGADPSKCSTPYDWFIVAKRTLPYFPVGKVIVGRGEVEMLHIQTHSDSSTCHLWFD